VILVINGTNAPAIEYFNELLKDTLGGDYSLFYNVNKRNDNVILTDEFIRVFGNEFVQDSFLQIKYLVGPQSFMQVNESVKARLYSKVCDFIDPNEIINNTANISELTYDNAWAPLPHYNNWNEDFAK
jgi:23S rRNA (uracil1939-C5)-methyltransferase